LAEHLGKKDFSKDEVADIKTESVGRNIREAKAIYLNLIAMGATRADIQDGVNHFKDQLEYNLNENFDARAIIGDNPAKLEYGTYGNNEVTGPDAMHGTHVAGIIGADRTNSKGVLGVADNVQIMTIRCVPNGDERDNG
jgi:subtilisin family serine protease